MKASEKTRVFTKFPKLPKELRLDIWELALRNVWPREVSLIIHVHLQRNEAYNAESGEDNYRLTHVHFESRSRSSTLPGDLQANRESRQIFLRHYPLFFQHHYSEESENGRRRLRSATLKERKESRNWGVRFNPELDTLGPIVQCHNGVRGRGDANIGFESVELLSKYADAEELVRIRHLKLFLMDIYQFRRALVSRFKGLKTLRAVTLPLRYRSESQVLRDIARTCKHEFQAEWTGRHPRRRVPQVLGPE